MFFVVVENFNNQDHCLIRISVVFCLEEILGFSYASLQKQVLSILDETSEYVHIRVIVQNLLGKCIHLVSVKVRMTILTSDNRSNNTFIHKTVF